MSIKHEQPSPEEILQMEEASFKKERAQRVDETPEQYAQERNQAWEQIRQKREQELTQTASLDEAAANKIRTELGIPESKSQSNAESQESNHEFLNLPTVQKAKELIATRLSMPNPDWKVINSAIYEMLTTRTAFAQALEKSGGDLVQLQKDRQAESDTYNKVLRPQLDADMKSAGFIGNDNPAWTGYNLRPEATKRTGPNIKVYETVDSTDPEYIKHLPDLGKRLRKVAVDSDDTMDVKVPNKYLGFLKHNDSLVVHFKNQENAPKVQEVIDQWMMDNNIKKAPRELNRTTVAVDQHQTDSADKSSFSELVAKNIEDWVKTHHGSYDNKVLAEQAVIHAINQSSKAPIITRS